MLALPVGALRNYLGGFPMPAEVARDIEWVMKLPAGWLDGELLPPEEVSDVSLYQASESAQDTAKQAIL